MIQLHPHSAYCYVFVIGCCHAAYLMDFTTPESFLFRKMLVVVSHIFNIKCIGVLQEDVANHDCLCLHSYLKWIDFHAGISWVARLMELELWSRLRSYLILHLSSVSPVKAKLFCHNKKSLGRNITVDLNKSFQICLICILREDYASF